MSTSSLPNLNNSQSLNELPRSLYDAKLSKKISEEELQKIQNRIALLKLEQMKLAKKIEQTDLDAYQIYLRKKNQQEKKQSKQRQESPVPFTYPIYIEQKKQLQQIKEETKQKRHYDAQSIRYQNKNDIKVIKDERKMYLESLRAKANQIKAEEIQSAYLASQKMKDRRIKIRNEVNQETLTIYSEKLTYDQLIKQLEIEELNALKQYQQTQHRQKQANEKLQQAQSLNPEQFEKVYGNSKQNE